jgi:hypothetical protein
MCYNSATQKTANQEGGATPPRIKAIDEDIGVRGVRLRKAKRKGK